MNLNVILQKNNPYIFSFCGSKKPATERTNIQKDKYIHSVAAKMKKNLHGVHCPCCGIKMLSDDEMKKVYSLKPTEPSKNVIPALKKHESCLHPMQAQAFRLLEYLSQQYPDYNLSELLQTVRGKYMIDLREENMQVIDKIRNESTRFSPKVQRNLGKLFSEIDKNYYKFSPEVFMQNNYVKRMRKIVEHHELDLKNVEKVRELTYIPNYGRSLADFVVRYSNPHSFRDSRDIVNAILKPSLATIEHIKAKNPSAKNGGGKNYPYNYLVECDKDNQARKDIPFIDFVRQHPEFYGKHLQKYMDEVIARINAGEAQMLSDYPLSVKRTLRRQSNGLLNPDISALKKSQTSKIKHI